jgi:ATP-dependent RNA helicase DeaD
VQWTRLSLNVGSGDGAAPGDILGAILGETGLPRRVVGSIEVTERTALVNVESQHSRAILARLNRTTIRGRTVKARVARENT